MFLVRELLMPRRPLKYQSVGRYHGRAHSGAHTVLIHHPRCPIARRDRSRPLCFPCACTRGRLCSLSDTPAAAVGGYGQGQPYISRALWRTNNHGPIRLYILMSQFNMFNINSSFCFLSLGQMFLT